MYPNLLRKYQKAFVQVFFTTNNISYLRFDALVHYARKQDKIVHILAAKKAKSLVTMLVQRRQYLKERERMREHHLLDLGLLGGLLSPRAEEPERDLQQKQHHQQYQRTRAASLPHSRAGSGCQIGGSPGIMLALCATFMKAYFKY